MLTVYRALDFVIVESNSVYNVVTPTTNRADRQAMTARANRVLERDGLFWFVSVMLREALLKSSQLTVPELIATQSSWL